MADKNYTLVVHYIDQVASLYDIDPDRYSIIDFRTDIKDLFVLPANPENITVATAFPKSKMPVKCDSDVLEMFERNKTEDYFDVYVDSDDTNPQVNVDARVNIENVDASVNVGSISGHSNVNYIVGKRNVNVNSEGCSNVVDDVQFDEDDDANSEDSLEIPDIDCDINLEEYENDISGCASEDQLFDYASDDHCEVQNHSDSDLDDDPLKGEFEVKGYMHDDNRDEVLFKKGMFFRDVLHLRKRLKDYVIQEGFIMRRKKNDLKRVTVECSNEACEWKLHASVMCDKITFKIKEYNGIHTCLRSDCTKEASIDWIASKLQPLLRNYPDMKPKDIERKLAEYNIKPGYMQIWRARIKAKEDIEGSHGGSYSKLAYYMRVLQQYNVGSVVKLQTYMDEGPKRSLIPNFLRFFVGIPALARGFLEGCHPFIGFDGCHLKGLCGGVLLAAISIDGNNGLYPLAFAVVESEGKESWRFFFEGLSELLGGFSTEIPWTLMSDRQKGLESVIMEMVPHARNRRCARHIYANFRLKFAGHALKGYFWDAARSYNRRGYTFAMNKINEMNPTAHHWLMQIPASMWSRHAFDINVKNDHCTNNISESFNHWVGELRGKPVLTLVDGLRGKLMSRLYQRRIKGYRWKNDIVPNVVKRLNEVRKIAADCKLLIAGDNKYEVQHGGTHYVVDVEGLTCQCGEWQLCGFPCAHAHKAIVYRREKLESYVSHSFTKARYMRAYNHMIVPVPDESLWPEMDDVQPPKINPPSKRNKPGRPKKNRRKEPWEGSSQGRSKNVRCQCCQQLGHNIRTCPDRIQGQLDETAAVEIPIQGVQAQSETEQDDHIDDFDAPELNEFYANLDNNEAGVAANQASNKDHMINNDLSDMRTNKNRRLSELDDIAAAKKQKQVAARKGNTEKPKAVNSKFKKPMQIGIQKGVVINDLPTAQVPKSQVPEVQHKSKKGKEKMVSVSQPTPFFDRLLVNFGTQLFKDEAVNLMGKNKAVVKEVPRAIPQFLSQKSPNVAANVDTGEKVIKKKLKFIPDEVKRAYGKE